MNSYELIDVINYPCFEALTMNQTTNTIRIMMFRFPISTSDEVVHRNSVCLGVILVILARGIVFCVVKCQR